MNQSTQNTQSDQNVQNTQNTQSTHLTVRGEATLQAEPERAHLHITTTARGTDRRKTLDDLTTRNRQALDLIQSHHNAVDTLHTSALVITPELREHSRGERVRAYHGQVRTTATLTDLTILGELTTRLADLELTTIDAITWSLRPDSPAHRTARQQAVQSAVQHAREYAEALGSHLTALLELTEEGLTTHPAPRERRATRAFAAVTSDDHPAPLDLEPERQTVQAHITAHFTISPPDLD